MAWLRLVFVEDMVYFFFFSFSRFRFRFRFRFRWASRRTYKAGLRKRTSKRMNIQVEGDVSCCTRLRELIRSADDTRGSSPPRISHWKVIIEIIFKLKYGGYDCAHRFSVKRMVLVASNLAKI